MCDYRYIQVPCCRGLHCDCMVGGWEVEAVLGADHNGDKCQILRTVYTLRRSPPLELLSQCSPAATATTTATRTRSTWQASSMRSSQLLSWTESLVSRWCWGQGAMLHSLRLSEPTWCPEQEQEALLQGEGGVGGGGGAGYSASPVAGGAPGRMNAK